ncbi:MAG: lactonase family protein [Sphingobacteriaceae bacterium]|nr:lactonase family protein [Sphingobacteriaceae bacterium]
MNKYSLSFLMLIAVGFCQAQSKKLNLVVGTYTNNCPSNGIYIYDFNPTTGNLTLKNSAQKASNASYLSLSADRKNLYAVEENGANSVVNAFDFNSKTGNLTFKNKVEVGQDPCYLINDSKNVMTANYTSGSVSVIRKNSQGGLEKLIQNAQHQGKGARTDRQEKAHTHMVAFSNDKKYVLANDLGTDTVYVYRYQANHENKPLAITHKLGMKSGSGPRHLTFNKKGNRVYILNELSGKIAVCSFEKGQLIQKNEISILPQGYEGDDIGSADIHLSPDGKFLYASNRGKANTLVTLKVLANGDLKLIDQISTAGIAPRNFALSPNGDFLLVANQRSNEIVTFKRNQQTGLLTDTKKRTQICAPVCLLFSHIN